MRLLTLIFLLSVSLCGCKQAEKATSTSAKLFQSADIQLQLSPQHIPVETLLTLSVTASQPVTAVSGSVSGVTMYMGSIPLRFVPDDSNLQWHAEFLLGACSEPAMQWQADITIEFADGKKQTIKQTFQSSWTQN